MELMGINIDWKILAGGLAAVAMIGSFMGYWRFEDFAVFAAMIGAIGALLFLLYQGNQKYKIGFNE